MRFTKSVILFLRLKWAGGLLALLALSALLPAPDSSATELTDLGQGLAYLRIHQLADVIKPLAGDHAIVLDLRYTNDSPAALAQFSTALSGRSADSILLVLVGPDTPASVAGTLKGNVLILGIHGSKPVPDVTVNQTAADDRRAYHALDSGVSLEQLISGKIVKERFDEASLVQEFKNGNHDAHPPALSQTEESSPGPVDSPALLTDRVLQRAVHLHRALLALRR